MRIGRFSVLFACLAIGGLAGAQTATDIDSDPHYSLQMANDQARVYLVTLRPTERSFVKHNHNFLLITLQDCQVAMWPEGTSDISHSQFSRGSIGFYYAGRAIGLRNDQNATYQNVTIELLDPKATTYGYHWTTGSWDYYGPTGTTAPLDPHKSFINQFPMGPLTALDVQLLPNDSLPIQGSNNSELLVPVLDVDLRFGDQSIQKFPGTALWITGRQAKLVNNANTPARFAVVEFPQ